MMERKILEKNRGFSLVEFLVVLVISGILVAALYRTFIGQQKTFTVEDQVVDMQQNIRLSTGQMIRMIRMAGYGGEILKAFTNVNGFTNIITPVHHANNIGTGDDSITIITSNEVSKLTQNAAKGSSMLSLNNAVFNTSKKKYLCLNGANNYLVNAVSSTNDSGSTITLATPLAEDHPTNEPVFLVKAITYKLQWDGTDRTMPVLVVDENTGGPSQLMAENIEKLQFSYTLSDGTVTDSPPNPATIRMVKVDITARTKVQDPALTGDGYRRRHLYSFVKVRNLGL